MRSKDRNNVIGPDEGVKRHLWESKTASVTYYDAAPLG